MQQRRYKPAFAASVLLHVVLLLVLIVNLELSSQMPVLENIDNNSKIISAVAMNAPPRPMAPTPPPVVPKVEPKPVVAPPKPKPVEQVQKKAEPAPPKVDQAIALEKVKQKKLLEKQLVEKQKAELQKQLLADLQKQKKKTHVAKQKALEKAMENEIKQQAEKALQQQILNEEHRVAGAKSLGVVNKYKALILQAISERWIVPPGVNKKLSSELLIRLAPGGVVLDVQVTRSSGDVSLDRSARDAVFKASPLPVPPKADEFDPFRQFVLKVKPENIVSADA